MTLLRLNSPTYSSEEVEAALCIWEELDRRTRPPERLHNLALFHWRAEHGTADLRTVAVDLARYADGMYQLLSAAEWNGLAFDWEIVPAILDTVAWHPFGPAPMLPLTRMSAMHLLEGLQANRQRSSVVRAPDDGHHRCRSELA